MTALRGRDGELTRAGAALDAGRDVLVVSARGSGTTTFMSRLVEERVGRPVLTADTSEQASRIPLGALIGPLAAVGLRSGEPRTGRSWQHVRPGDLTLELFDALVAIGSMHGTPILVVDRGDLLDPTSAIALRSASSQRLAQVLVSLPSPAAATDALSRWAATAATVELDRLDEATLVAVAEDRLGGTLGSRSARMLVVASEGGPATLVELLDHGLATGALAAESGVWSWRGRLTVPERLVRMTTERIDNLDPSIRDLLAGVAVAGRVPAGAAARLWGRSVLDAALVQGTLTNGDDGLLTVARPLDAAALDGTASLSERRATLTALVEALGTGHELPPPSLMALAGWLVELDDGSRPLVILDGADAEFRSGHIRRAERLLDAAIQAGAGPEAGPLLDRINAVEGRSASTASEAQDADDEAVFAAAMATADSFLLGLGPVAVALEGIRHARERLRPGRRPEELAAMDLMVRFHDGEPAESVAASGRRMIVETPERSAAVRVALPLGASLALLGATSDAVAVMEQAVDDMNATDLGPFMQTQVMATLAQVLMYDGRIHDARHLADAGYRTASEDGDAVAAVGWAMVLGQIDLWQGRPLDAGRHLVEAVTGMGGLDLVGYRSRGVADLELARAWTARTGRARPDGATDRFGATRDGCGDRDGCGQSDPSGQSSVPEAWRAVVSLSFATSEAVSGRHATAFRTATRAAETALGLDQAAVAAQALFLAVRIRPVRQLVDQMRRITVGAQGRFLPDLTSSAMAIADRDPVAIETAATTWWDLGLHGLAIEHLERSAAAHHRRGCDPAARRCRALASSWAGTSGAVPLIDIPSERLPCLTPRESEVATLAATGLTNHQVAAHLGLSVRTVHSHLQSVYRKVGVNDRSRLTDLLTTSELRIATPDGDLTRRAVGDAADTVGR